MAAKWADAALQVGTQYSLQCTRLEPVVVAPIKDHALQVVAFDEAAEGEAGASSPAFVAYAVHAFSLLHATALHSLRGDSMDGALVPLHPRVSK